MNSNLDKMVWMLSHTMRTIKVLEETIRKRIFLRENQRNKVFNQHIPRSIITMSITLMKTERMRRSKKLHKWIQAGLKIQRFNTMKLTQLLNITQEHKLPRLNKPKELTQIKKVLRQRKSF